MDGMELIAGESGLNRIVSWFYLVQTRPYEDYMNYGNFALIVIDNVRFDFGELKKTMEELNGLGISGLAVSVEDDREMIPDRIIKRAEEMELPLFWVRWKGASFVDISQSIGNLIMESNILNKRTGDYLYNLLFGYSVNDRYVEKISGQFGLDFSKPYRVGIIVVDRKYGVNMEQDEHIYEYYANCLNQEVIKMEGQPMFMRFLNKFVLLFEAREDKNIEKKLEIMLRRLDDNPQFRGVIQSTCILGAAYTEPSKFGQSYQEAKNLIAKKKKLPNPSHKKVLSASTMGIYKYMFHSDDQGEIIEYCNNKLNKIEEYDHVNGTFLKETILAYYMNGFNTVKTAENLFIHRNSLMYRLRKIEELLEMELTDYMEYLDLVNCILVKQWMFL
ncbi:MAG: PucR family transcriptional regulator ligand-binding domain-containing protein [Lachnospiraceae bacterium]|nr:PucR family transcriptional regulator ligand-binding domain-containing protein [Lachnospiraceae bacterium]